MHVLKMEWEVFLIIFTAPKYEKHSNYLNLFQKWNNKNREKTLGGLKT